MRSRLLWALLILAAVFSMHGLSCAASVSTPTTSPIGTSVVTDTGFGTSMAMTTAGALAATPHTSPQLGASAMTDGGDHPAGHDVSLHTLMVCLAVLAGGAGAVLAAWLSRRRSPAVVLALATRLPRVLTGCLRCCLPAPDLSRLCVLRV